MAKIPYADELLENADWPKRTKDVRVPVTEADEDADDEDADDDEEEEDDKKRPKQNVKFHEIR